MKKNAQQFSFRKTFEQRKRFDELRQMTLFINEKFMFKSREKT